MPSLPASSVIIQAWEHLRSVLHPAVFNHSVRTFVYARASSSQPGETSVNAEALLLACLFHDAGTADPYNGRQRFEVEGADAAARFLARREWTEAAIRPIWEAIALHTSPGIGERIHPLARHTRHGVRIDFGDSTLLPAAEGASLARAAERDYARLDIEAVLVDLVVTQALDSPTKAPASSWPGGLLRAHLEHTTTPGLNRAF